MGAAAALSAPTSKEPPRVAAATLLGGVRAETPLAATKRQTASFILHTACYIPREHALSCESESSELECQLTLGQVKRAAAESRAGR